MGRREVDMATTYSSSDGPRPSASQVRLLSLRDAATYLSLSHWTLRELIWRGELACVKVGRRILVDVRDLENFIERNKQTESW
jgi:excisionase family DNA binding protein